MQPNEPVSPDGTAPRSVIVADDTIEIQLLLAMWLRAGGWLVKCASTGNEVTRLLRQQHFDLIVTDMIMPDGDGLDVMAELKRTHSNVPVLAISGGGRHLQAEACLKFAKGLGAHDVLFKPFNREQFMAAVDRLTQGGV